MKTYYTVVRVEPKRRVLCNHEIKVEAEGIVEAKAKLIKSFPRLAFTPFVLSTERLDPSRPAYTLGEKERQLVDGDR